MKYIHRRKQNSERRYIQLNSGLEDIQNIDIPEPSDEYVNFEKAGKEYSKFIGEYEKGRVSSQISYVWFFEHLKDQYNDPEKKAVTEHFNALEKRIENICS